MTYSQYQAYLSAPRLDKYKIACNNQSRKALSLYRANIRLSQKLYAVIGLFEIVLRNQIDRHFIALKGPQWLEDAVESGGYLDAPDCENSYHSIQEAIHRLGTKYSHEGLIAALTLGFWTYQFGKYEYPASGNTALNIFINRPKGVTYKEMQQYLMKINILRNRVAHHEPVCFDDFGLISTAMVVKRYALIKDLLQWMGCDPDELFYGIDGVQKEINYITAFASSI